MLGALTVRAALFFGQAHLGGGFVGVPIFGHTNVPILGWGPILEHSDPI